jgi:hypothetical protein
MTHAQAFCLFPNETHIKRQSLVNRIGRLLNYVPGTGSSPLASYSYRDNNKTRHLLLSYASSECEIRESAMMDLNHGLGLRPGPFQALPASIQTSDESIRLCCIHDRAAFDNWPEQSYFPNIGRRLSEDAGRSWSIPLISLFAASPSTECNYTQALTLPQNAVWRMEDGWPKFISWYNCLSPPQAPPSCTASGTRKVHSRVRVCCLFLLVTDTYLIICHLKSRHHAVMQLFFKNSLTVKFEDLSICISIVLAPSLKLYGIMDFGWKLINVIVTNISSLMIPAACYKVWVLEA